MMELCSLEESYSYVKVFFGQQYCFGWCCIESGQVTITLLALFYSLFLSIYWHVICARKQFISTQIKLVTRLPDFIKEINKTRGKRHSSGPRQKHGWCSGTYFIEQQIIQTRIPKQVTSEQQKLKKDRCIRVQNPNPVQNQFQYQCIIMQATHNVLS